MDSPAQHASGFHSGDAAAGADGEGRGTTALALRDLVTTGIGAVMALHSVDRATATTTLRHAADRFQVPVSAVAHAVLTLVSGTDEQFGDRAGRAATHLLVEGFTSRERDAGARDTAADRRDDLADKREAVLDHREAAIQSLLAAADERDRLAEGRDRRADERDRAAERRPFTSQQEHEAAALDRELSAMDRFASGVDRDHGAGDRAELMGLPRGQLRRRSGDPE